VVVQGTVKQVTPPVPSRARPSSRSRIAWAVLGLLGGALGVSQLVYGAYNESTWAPIALGALAVAVALAIGFPRRPPLALLVPLLALWLWSLISSGWSESADNSVIAADRWLLYAADLAVLWWLIGDSRRRAVALLGGAGAGVLAVGIYILVRMLAGDGAALFLGARLNDPLGYVNGEAGYLLAGLWPCLALGERRGSSAKSIWAGAGLAGMVVVVGVGLMTQSRGAMLALAGTTLLLLAAVPGRRRRAAALLLVAAAIAVIYPTVSNVWRHPSPVTGLPTTEAMRHAATAVLLAAVLTAIAWMAAVDTLERLAPGGSAAGGHVASLGNYALGLLGLGAVLVVAVNIPSIAHRIRTQYDSFVHLSPSPGSTRLFSGGGNRYDYWRVAVLEFRSEPLIGVGAGNYQPGYYLHRRTTEDIQQPHSIELQTLAELGLVGAALLLAFFVAVGVGVRRTARAARGDPLERWLAVAGGGIFAGWLIETSVDWIHLLPGLTTIALAAAIALVASQPTRTAALTGRTRLALIAATAAVAAAGVVTIAPRALSLGAQTDAQHALADRQPVGAIRDATTALSYDPNSVEALVLRAAGFARLDAFAPTLADLRRAIALEPRNWATWALLGDLFTRRGDTGKARSAYEHALRLDPLEDTVKSALAAITPRSKPSSS
jgi:hypothetical protein